MQVHKEFSMRCESSYDNSTPEEERGKYLECTKTGIRVQDRTKKHVGLFTFLIIKFLVYQYGLMFAKGSVLYHNFAGVNIQSSLSVAKDFLEFGKRIPHKQLIAEIIKTVEHIHYEHFEEAADANVVNYLRKEISLKLLQPFNDAEKDTIDEVLPKLHSLIENKVTTLSEGFAIDYTPLEILYDFFAIMLYGHRLKSGIHVRTIPILVHQIRNAQMLFKNTSDKTWIVQFLHDQEVEQMKEFKSIDFQPESVSGLLEESCLKVVYTTATRNKTESIILKFVILERKGVPPEDYTWTGREQLDAENPDYFPEEKKGESSLQGQSIENPDYLREKEKGESSLQGQPIENRETSRPIIYYEFFPSK